MRTARRIILTTTAVVLAALAPSIAHSQSNARWHNGQPMPAPAPAPLPAPMSAPAAAPEISGSVLATGLGTLAGIVLLARFSRRRHAPESVEN